MKKSLIATLVAAPLLSLSSLTFAAPAPAEPMTLSAAEMDSVTAGQFGSWAGLLQFNVSPITVVQLNILSNGLNLADILSGNLGTLLRR